MDLTKEVVQDFRTNEFALFEIRAEIESRPKSEQRDLLIKKCDSDIGWLYLVEETAKYLPDELASQWVEFYLNGTGKCETFECEESDHSSCIWDRLFEEVIDTLGDTVNEYGQVLSDLVFNGTIEGNKLMNEFPTFEE